MIEAYIIAIATIATRMNIFFLFLGGFFSEEEGDCEDKRGSIVKQYNIKEIEYNR
jgi:hypothetical protein